MKPPPAMTSPPLGVRCWPVPLDDGRFAVLSRGRSTAPGAKVDGEFFGGSPFQVVRSDGQTVVVAARPEPEPVIDRRPIWTPDEITVGGTPGSYSSLPAYVEFTFSFAIEAAPPAALYRPIASEFFLVMDINGTEVYAEYVDAGQVTTLFGAGLYFATIDTGELYTTTGNFYLTEARSRLLATYQYDYTIP